MGKTSRFIIRTLRLILQIIGTYFVGKFTIEKIVSIPAETWGWMALIVAIVILLIMVWVYTLYETFKTNQKDK